MMACRSSLLMADQRAISSSVRPQPRHKSEVASIWQTSMQGVSKRGFGVAVNRTYVSGGGRPGNRGEARRASSAARQRFHHPLAWETDNDLRALTGLAFQIKGAAMQLGQTFGDGEAGPRATFTALVV